MAAPTAYEITNDSQMQILTAQAQQINAQITGTQNIITQTQASIIVYQNNLADQQVAYAAALAAVEARLVALGLPMGPVPKSDP